MKLNFDADNNFERRQAPLIEWKVSKSIGSHFEFFSEPARRRQVRLMYRDICISGFAHSLFWFGRRTLERRKRIERKWDEARERSQVCVWERDVFLREEKVIAAVLTPTISYDLSSNVPRVIFSWVWPNRCWAGRWWCVHHHHSCHRYDPLSHLPFSSVQMMIVRMTKYHQLGPLSSLVLILTYYF